MCTVHVTIGIIEKIVFQTGRAVQTVERVIEKMKYYPSAVKMSVGNSSTVDMPQNILGKSSDHKTSSCAIMLYVEKKNSS